MANAELLCSACVHGYFIFRDECNECPAATTIVLSLLAGVACFALLALLLALFGEQLEDMGGIPSLMFNAVQSIGVIAVLQVRWPAALRDFLLLFNFFSFDLDAVGPQCLGVSTSYNQWWLFFMLLLSALTALAMAPWERFFKSGRIEKYLFFFRKTYWVREKNEKE